MAAERAPEIATATSVSRLGSSSRADEVSAGPRHTHYPLDIPSTPPAARPARSPGGRTYPRLREYIWKNELEDPDAATSAWGARLKRRRF